MVLPALELVLVLTPGTVHWLAGAMIDKPPPRLGLTLFLFPPLQGRVKCEASACRPGDLSLPAELTFCQGVPGRL
jgi:hypothetical protein